MSTWEFDTGGSSALLTQIGLGYLGVLAPLLASDITTPGPRGPYLKTLHQIPVLPDARWLEQDRGFPFLREFPSAAVVVRGARADKERAIEIDWLIDVDVVIGSAFGGQTVAGRLNDATEGNAGDPGVFVMLQHATELLQGARVDAMGLCAGSIHVTEQLHHMTSNTHTLWVLRTWIQATQAINADRDALPLNRIEVNHRVEEGGTISSQERQFP